MFLILAAALAIQPCYGLTINNTSSQYIVVGGSLFGGERYMDVYKNYTYPYTTTSYYILCEPKKSLEIDATRFDRIDINHIDQEKFENWKSGRSEPNIYGSYLSITFSDDSGHEQPPYAFRFSKEILRIGKKLSVDVLDLTSKELYPSIRLALDTHELDEAVEKLKMEKPIMEAVPQFNHSIADLISGYAQKHENDNSCTIL